MSSDSNSNSNNNDLAIVWYSIVVFLLILLVCLVWYYKTRISDVEKRIETIANKKEELVAYMKTSYSSKEQFITSVLPNPYGRSTYNQYVYTINMIRELDLQKYNELYECLEELHTFWNSTGILMKSRIGYDMYSSTEKFMFSQRFKLFCTYFRPIQFIANDYNSNSLWYDDFRIYFRDFKDVRLELDYHDSVESKFFVVYSYSSLDLKTQGPKVLRS